MTGPPGRGVDPWTVTVRQMRAETAIDNAAVRVLASRLDPDAVLPLLKWQHSFDPSQPRDEHGRFASTNPGRRKGRRSRRHGPIRTFFTNASREAGRVTGRAAGHLAVAAAPILMALAANEFQRRQAEPAVLDAEGRRVRTGGRNRAGSRAHFRGFTTS